MQFLKDLSGILFLVFVAILLFFDSIFEDRKKREKNIKIKYLEEDNNKFRNMLYDCGKVNDVIDYDRTMNRERFGGKPE